jgi:hypothetical protein
VEPVTVTLSALVANLGLDAAAFVPTARQCFVHGNFDEGALLEVAATARHVFRETQPAVPLIDLHFESGRLLVAPAGKGVLFLRAPSGPMDEELLEAQLAAARERLTDGRWEVRNAAPDGAQGEASGAQPQAASRDASPPLSKDDVLAITLATVNLLAQSSRAHLGGAVIRNYMRGTQTELAAQYPFLKAFTTSLEGKTSLADDTLLRDGSVTADAVASAMGAWVRAYAERASRVAPEVARLDVRAMARSAGAGLEHTGFFAVITTT